MQVWSWFLVPPTVLAAAYYLGDSVVPAPVAPPPLPTVQPLSLSPTIQAWADAPQPLLTPRAAEPRDIRLAAFGITAPAARAAIGPVAIGPAAALPPAPLPRADQLFRLESVLVTGDQRLAVINGSVFQSGEQVAPRYLLVEVQPDQVWLHGPRGREALSFPEWRDAPPLAGDPAAPRYNPTGAPVPAHR